MDIQRPLFWHQGLFLQPQHLQLLDLSFQSLLTPFRHFIEPHFWGVGEIDIQKAALGNRIFNPLRGHFLFPDGAYAVLRGLSGNGLVEARPFEEAWVEGGKPFSVYLGIKKWNDAGPNVTVLEKLEHLSEVTTRFVTTPHPEQVEDLHSGGPQGQIKRLYYVLKIFWQTEGDQLGDYVLIPLAELERVGEEIRLSEHYIPPSLSIASSEPLLKLMKEIRDQISAQSRRFEEYKSQRGVTSVEFGTKDMVYFLALRSLNRYVPLFFHMIEAQQVHPWMAYGILRQLIGELSSFSEEINVLGEMGDGTVALPLYDHRNLWECFSIAQKLITQIIDKLAAEAKYVLLLINDGTYFAAELKPEHFERRNRFYLVFRTEEDPKFVLQSLTTIAKLSSREQLPILIARALPGIELEHLSVPPQELPRRAHSIYFAVDHHSDQWNFVEKGRNIALYWDSAPEDLKVELMIV